MDYFGQSMYDRRYGEEYQGYTDDEMDTFIFNDLPAKVEASPLSSKITQCRTCGGHNNWGRTYCDLCELAEGYRDILINDSPRPLEPEQIENKVIDLVNRTPQKKEAA